MDAEVIDRGQSILEKLKNLDFSSFTFMDLIFIVGVITLFVLAVKVVSRFFKAVLVILAIIVLLVWLYTQGLLPFNL